MDFCDLMCKFGIERLNQLNKAKSPPRESLAILFVDSQDSRDLRFDFNFCPFYFQKIFADFSNF